MSILEQYIIGLIRRNIQYIYIYYQLTLKLNMVNINRAPIEKHLIISRTKTGHPIFSYLSKSYFNKLREQCFIVVNCNLTLK